MTGITRLTDSSFSLGNIGTYQVFFEASFTEAVQLVLTLNGTEIPYTVVGNSANGSQITGISLITTTAENSVLTVRNPTGTATAVTLTPSAGGTNPVSAHLLITRIQ